MKKKIQQDWPSRFSCRSCTHSKINRRGGGQVVRRSGGQANPYVSLKSEPQATAPGGTPQNRHILRCERWPKLKTLFWAYPRCRTCRKIHWVNFAAFFYSWDPCAQVKFWERFDRWFWRYAMRKLKKPDLGKKRALFGTRFENRPLYSNKSGILKPSDIFLRNFSFASPGAYKKTFKKKS